MCSVTASGVETVSAGIDACAAVALADLPAGMQVAELSDLLVAERRIAAEIARRLAAAEASEALEAETGYGPRTWLMAENQLSGAEASRRMAVARALSGLPLLAAAFTAGEVSHDHARVLVKTLRQLPAEHRAAAEKILVGLARTQPPEAVATAVAVVRERLGLDEDAEAAAVRRQGERRLDFARTFDGWMIGEFLLPPEAGAALEQVIAAISQPAGPEDDRTPTQRRADAMGELAEDRLEGGPLPDEQGERPRVVITLDYQWLCAQLDQASLTTQERLSAPPTLEGRWALSAATARRLLCDADILPAVLDGQTTNLELGRTSKTWSVAQRRAVRLRDGQLCAFGNCPNRWTRLHHAHWWSRGGPTDLDNAVPLCKFHHRLVHEGGWSVKRLIDGSYLFTNPNGVEHRFRRHTPFRQPQPV